MKLCNIFFVDLYCSDNNAVTKLTWSSMIGAIGEKELLTLLDYISSIWRLVCYMFVKLFLAYLLPDYSAYMCCLAENILSDFYMWRCLLSSLDLWFISILVASLLFDNHTTFFLCFMYNAVRKMKEIIKQFRNYL